LLDTEFDTLLAFDHVNADRDNGIPFDLKGREQAHAPGYQAVVGGTYASNFYETEPYNQFGAPRVVGIRGSVQF